MDEESGAAGYMICGGLHGDNTIISGGSLSQAINNLKSLCYVGWNTSHSSPNYEGGCASITVNASPVTTSTILVLLLGNRNSSCLCSNSLAYYCTQQFQGSVVY